MTLPPGLLHRLRNLTVGELTRALERDGFLLYRRTRGSHRIYRHPDSRKVVIPFHRASDTLPRGTLADILRGTQWTEQDARRLGLI
ncbi:MAG: addiction module toxin, HicA family [Chloroflexi bacterium]|nr:addiction module toxin, HicA family [Chloroflexota bacterium]MYE42160.1 addiction module toxin, HicA family [Chloroflexota bacterium]